MIKKALFTVFVLCSVFSAQAKKPEQPIPWRQNITMLVVPREPQVVEVALDVTRYYPVLLVCYQPMPSGLLLHAWNGKGWVAVSEEEYANGTFFSTPPKRAVIVESEQTPAPDSLIPDGSWCPRGFRLSSTDRRVLIHLLGRQFNFPYRYWLQFSKRYNYEIEEINPTLINIVWWHYRGDKLLPALKERDYEADMSFWQPLEISQPEPIEPVQLIEPESVEPAETPAEEPEPQKEIEEETEQEITVDTPEEKAMVGSTNDIEKIIQELSEPAEAPAQKFDPFSTNDVPAAELVPLPTE